MRGTYDDETTAEMAKRARAMKEQVRLKQKHKGPKLEAFGVVSEKSTHFSNEIVDVLDDFEIGIPRQKPYAQSAGIPTPTPNPVPKNPYTHQSNYPYNMTQGSTYNNPAPQHNNPTDDMIDDLYSRVANSGMKRRGIPIISKKQPPPPPPPPIYRTSDSHGVSTARVSTVGVEGIQGWLNGLKGEIMNHEVYRTSLSNELKRMEKGSPNEMKQNDGLDSLKTLFNNLQRLHKFLTILFDPANSSLNDTLITSIHAHVSQNIGDMAKTIGNITRVEKYADIQESNTWKNINSLIPFCDKELKSVDEFGRQSHSTLVDMEEKRVNNAESSDSDISIGE